MSVTALGADRTSGMRLGTSSATSRAPATGTVPVLAHAASRRQPPSAQARGRGVAPTPPSSRASGAAPAPTASGETVDGEQLGRVLLGQDRIQGEQRPRLVRQAVPRTTARASRRATGTRCSRSLRPRKRSASTAPTHGVSPHVTPLTRQNPPSSTVPDGSSSAQAAGPSTGRPEASTAATDSSTGRPGGSDWWAVGHLLVGGEARWALDGEPSRGGAVHRRPSGPAGGEGLGRDVLGAEVAVDPVGHRQPRGAGRARRGIRGQRRPPRSQRRAGARRSKLRTRSAMIADVAPALDQP